MIVREWGGVGACRQVEMGGVLYVGCGVCVRHVGVRVAGCMVDVKSTAVR